MDHSTALAALSCDLRRLDYSRQAGMLQPCDGVEDLLVARLAIERRALVAEVAWAGAVFVELLARLPWIESMLVEMRRECVAAPESEMVHALEVVEVRSNTLGTPPGIDEPCVAVQAELESGLLIEAADLANSLLFDANWARLKVERARVAHLIDSNMPVGLDAAMALWPKLGSVEVIASLLTPQEPAAAARTRRRAAEPAK